MPNGYSLRFAAERDVLSEIARTVDNERQCCRFLRFAVTVEVVSLEAPAPHAGRP